MSDDGRVVEAETFLGQGPVRHGTLDSRWLVVFLNGSVESMTGVYESDLELGAVRFFDFTGLLAEYNFGAVEGVVRDDSPEEEV
jgi:hypothetical protein